MVDHFIRIDADLVPSPEGYLAVHSHLLRKLSRERKLHEVRSDKLGAFSAVVSPKVARSVLMRASEFTCESGAGVEDGPVDASRFIPSVHSCDGSLHRFLRMVAIRSLKGCELSKGNAQELWAIRERNFSDLLAGRVCLRDFAFQYASSLVSALVFSDVRMRVELEIYLLDSGQLSRARRSDCFKRLRDLSFSSSVSQASSFFDFLMVSGLDRDVAISYAMVLAFACIKTLPAAIMLMSDLKVNSLGFETFGGNLSDNMVQQALLSFAPLPVVRRTASIDVDLEGYQIPAGGKVLIFLNSMDDSAKNAEVSRFGLAFGHGPHYCLGAKFAISELTHVADIFIRGGGAFDLPRKRFKDCSFGVLGNYVVS